MWWFVKKIAIELVVEVEVEDNYRISSWLKKEDCEFLRENFYWNLPFKQVKWQLTQCFSLIESWKSKTVHPEKWHIYKKEQDWILQWKAWLLLALIFGKRLVFYKRKMGILFFKYLPKYLGTFTKDDFHGF